MRIGRAERGDVERPAIGRYGVVIAAQPGVDDAEIGKDLDIAGLRLEDRAIAGLGGYQVARPAVL